MTPYTVEALEQVWDGLRGHLVLGEICDPMHFDKENKRLHA